MSLLSLTILNVDQTHSIIEWFFEKQFHLIIVFDKNLTDNLVNRVLHTCQSVSQSRGIGIAPSQAPTKVNKVL